VSADPAAGLGRPRLGVGADRFVGQPVFDVVGQQPRRYVAVGWLEAMALRQIASRAGGTLLLT